MWEKLNFFRWNKKKEAQPVQREVSITLSNGERQEVIQRSPSGTKLASSSVQHGFEDDDSSEGSTSLNFGVKANASPRRNSSYSFSREPLDLPTWSNVTSPGFTSRLVQQAAGHSPLKEFNDSLSFSPFRNSPHGHMQLGELPHVSFARKPKLSPPVFPSPHKSLRSGVSSSVYNRDRRRNARQGTVFVRIAPIDPSTKANISLTGKTPSPTVTSVNNGSPYPPRGSPRSGESFRSEGLGGIPSQELAMRFNRMWSPPPGSAMTGRPSSPTSPSNSNIVEALTAGRKRVREQDAYYGLPGSVPPPSSSQPSKISVGIGDTPARPQMSKRVKFLGATESQDRPMMVPYSGMGGGDTEPLSSESILEQMNQTEKRFLPDSTSTPYNISKKSRLSSAANIEEQSSTLQSALRKRRNQSNIMSANDEDTRGEKLGRFCRCNECYAEAAGVSSFIQPQTTQRSGSTSAGGSPNKLDDTATSPGKTNQHETCDRGVSTEPEKAAFFREIFKKPDKKPVEKVDEIMKRAPVVLTKEMYDKDKQKRIERYYRILSLKPQDGTIFDVTAEPVSKPSSVVSGETSNTSFSGAVTTTSDTNGGFNPGTLPPSTTIGFSFGKQMSPGAITNTTSVCSTISSHSSTGTTFGSSTASVTAPSATVPSTFGQSLTSGTSSGLSSMFGSPASTGLAAATNGSISFGGTSTPSTNSAGFSFGKQTSPDATTNPNGAGSTNSSTALSTGSTFSSTTAAAVGTSANEASPFGQPLTSGTSGGVTGGLGIGTSSGGTSATTGTTGTSFAAGVSSAASTGFSFGKQTPSVAPASNTNTTNIVGSDISSIPSTGSTGMAPSVAAPSLFGQSLTSGTSSGFGSTSSNNEKTSGNGSGGFSFSGDSTALATATTIAPATTAFGTLSSPATTATAVSSSTLGFGVLSSTSVSQPPAFGAGNNSLAPNLVPKSSTVAAPQPQPSTGGFSFGGAAQNQSTPAPASSSFGGFAFGQSNAASSGSAPTAANPAGIFQFGQTSSNASSDSASKSSSDVSDGASLFPQVNNTSSTGNTFGATGMTSVTTAASPFGQPLTSGTPSGLSGAFGSTAPTTTAGVNPAGFSFGSPAPATTSGGFSFGKPMAPVAIANTTSVVSSITSPSTGVNAFGSSSASVTAPSANAVSPFGQSFASTTSTGLTGGFGSVPPNNSNNKGGATGAGGFNFASVPNPLAKATTSAPVAPTFGTFGSPATTTASAPSTAPTFGSFGGPSTTAGSTSTGGLTFGSFGGPATTSTTSSTPAFGSLSSTSASQPSVFGSGNNNNAGFSFGSGSNALSPPQSQPSTGGFGFGSTTQQQSAPAPASSSSFGGFAFGQSNAPAALPAPAAAAPNPAGVFQFGQPANNTPTGAAAAPFQFGQQASQGVPGGFNFAAAAPAGMPNQMFSVGTTNTAPRRRDPRRRHR
ncbi:unnamed protein product [Orchesella dallaii]|uniref:Uncharacterized protein n=1 Tax=Orchesella dallaii TaxID=48710 RepID=A0ABP1RM33_9HEXA